MMNIQRRQQIPKPGVCKEEESSCSRCNSEQKCEQQAPNSLSGCPVVVCLPKKSINIENVNKNNSNNASQITSGSIIGISCGGTAILMILIGIIAFTWWFIKNKNKIHKEGGIYNYIKKSQTRAHIKEHSYTNSQNSSGINRIFYQDPVEALRDYNPIHRKESARSNKLKFSIDSTGTYSTKTQAGHLQHDGRFINQIDELKIASLKKSDRFISQIDELKLSK